MNRTAEMIEVSRRMREIAGLSKTEMFWKQVDFGLMFLKLEFGSQAMDISNCTNFWDLLVFEWTKHDEFSYYELNVFTEWQYWRAKDLTFYEQLKSTVYDFLEEKK